MEYMSITQAAEKWGITQRRIQVLCKEERIPGAIRIGYAWAVPSDTEKPKDARMRSGEYVKVTANTADKERRGEVWLLKINWASPARRAYPREGAYQQKESG